MYMYELLLCVVVGWKTRSGTSYAVDPPVGPTCGHCPVGRIAAFPGYTTGTWGWTLYPFMCITWKKTHFDNEEATKGFIGQT